MKTLKTSGDFMLVCPETRVVFDPNAPTKVERISDFMKDRLDSGDLVLCEAKEPAKEAEIAGTDNVKAALAAAPKKKGK